MRVVKSVSGTWHFPKFVKFLPPEKGNQAATACNRIIKVAKVHDADPEESWRGIPSRDGYPKICSECPWLEKGFG